MTGLRNILVHLDSGERTAVRLSLAAALAAQHSARLVGLFAQCGEARSIGVVASWPNEQYRAADASRQAFAAAARLDDPEWRDANRGGDAEIVRMVTGWRAASTSSSSASRSRTGRRRCRLTCPSRSSCTAGVRRW